MHLSRLCEEIILWANPAFGFVRLSDGYSTGSSIMQSKDAIRAIKERLNIVDVVRRYVELKRNGPRWVAPCPFHQETKPSFSVNEDQGLFYCFGCHASGDVFDFYSRINGLEFKETLEQLAAEAGITIDRGPRDPQRDGQERKQRSARQQMLRMYELAAGHFASALQSPEAEECRRYIEKRGLSDEIVQRFGLGWARREWQSLADALRRAGFDMRMAAEAGLVGQASSGRPYDRFRGRLIFPIKSLSNQIIAFGGRIIADEEEAKYINSADTPLYKKGEHLYGLAQARRGIVTKGRAMLTEGYMDVLTLHQFGYDNAVGVLGTALTPEQIKRLSGFASQMTLLFDGDRAGRKAALRSCEMLLTRGLSCSVVIMGENQRRAFSNCARLCPAVSSRRRAARTRAASASSTFCISSARAGQSSCAACEGVAARRSAVMSARVTSTSCPMPASTGRRDSNTASATASSLKAHKSSSEPPPRTSTTACAQPCALASCSARTMEGAASAPCTRAGNRRMRAPLPRLAASSIKSCGGQFRQPPDAHSSDRTNRRAGAGCPRR